MPLGSDLAAAQRIAFGQDADKPFGVIDHRQTADMVIEHQPNGPMIGVTRPTATMFRVMTSEAFDGHHPSFGGICQRRFERQ